MSDESKVEHARLSEIRPTPENDDIYSRLSVDDPDVKDLIASVRERGVVEPIHVSSDGYIISGHRRRFSAIQAGLSEVPVIRHDISYRDDRDAFLKMLVEMNTQRKKTTGMLLREELVKVDAKEAHQKIVNERKEKDRERLFGMADKEIEVGLVEDRKRISRAKIPMLEAVVKVLNDHREYWPLSVRQVHYRLLGPDAPLRHASKPGSQYANNKASYNDLCDLLARARTEGRVPYSAIDDETRPEELNNHYWNPADFFKDQIHNFLRGYGRNRQQSQPHHIEIIAEKLTVRSILSGIASEYSLPLTINRGMSGPTVKRKIAERFRRSKKDKLILLVVSDLDPAGDAIAEDIAKSFERDFAIDDVEAYKVALTIDQVDEHSLEPSMEAKDSSPTYRSFVARYGITDAYELEALEPATLQEIVDAAILEVMDLDAYNAELEREEQDSVHIQAVKSVAIDFFKTLKLEGAE